jgi:hypothetical protein
MVLNLSDNGAGSLRAAIAAANANPGADTIEFAKGLHGTIKLMSSELLITDSVTIVGPGANQLSVSGSNSLRVFDMTAGQNVTIGGLTITDGFALEDAGGILNQGSNLTLSADVLSDNTASAAPAPPVWAAASRAWAAPCPSPAARSPATRRWPARRRTETRLAAAFTSWRALPRSATARSAATWPAEAITAVTDTREAEAFLPMYPPP